MGLLRRSAAGPTPVLVDDAAQDDADLVAVRDRLVAGGAWQEAAALLASTTGDSDRRGAVVTALAEDTGPARGGWLDQWTAAEPDDAGATLLAAMAAFDRAGEARGDGWAEDTDEDAMTAFARLLDGALPLAHEAARRGGDDPTPWVLLLWMAVGRGESRDVFDDRWAELVRRDPHNRLGYIAGLQYLAAKWHGSHEDMYALARAGAGAPWGPVLPLQGHIEYLITEGHGGSDLLGGFWERPEPAADLQAGLAWARSGPHTHAYALHDLTVVGFCLDQADRWREALEVFELTGHRAYRYPWNYLGDPRKAFAKAHKTAVKKGS